MQRFDGEQDGASWTAAAGRRRHRAAGLEEFETVDVDTDEALD